jgi:transcription antitermination factor NusG
MYKLARSDKRYRETWRGLYSPDLHWYGVMTQYGQERRIKSRILAELRRAGVEETLLPEIQTNGGAASEELLFPCYLFICCRMNDQIYMQISQFEGVLSVLGRAWRIPSIVNETEIKHLRAILTPSVHPELARQRAVGAQVEVVAGILKGLRGRVLEESANHFKLETRFSFLNAGTGITISIPRSEVRLTSESHAEPMRA